MKLFKVVLQLKLLMTIQFNKTPVLTFIHHYECLTVKTSQSLLYSTTTDDLIKLLNYFKRLALSIKPKSRLKKKISIIQQNNRLTNSLHI